MPSTYRYSYPNWKSYQMIPPRPRVGLYNGQLLRHGYIFGYKFTGASTSPPNVNPYTGASTNSGTGNVHPAAPAYRQIDWTTAMVFQFNPVHLRMDVAMMPVDSPDMAAPGANLPDYAPGLATTSLQLFFDRTNEIARATMGNPGRAGETKFKELGVQVDLFDFLRVISGGDTSVLGQYEDPPPEEDSPFTGTVSRDSLNRLTGMLMDSVVSGSQIMMKPFAVVFNQNLAINVMKMTSFAFDFVRFTADLVPTTVQIDMTLEVSNMGTKAFATSAGGAPPLAPGAPPPGVTPPGATTPGAVAQSITSGLGII
jgi:hypothetical protein